MSDSITVHDGHGRGGYKRSFDLVVLVLAHILLLPLWIVLWTSIPMMIWLNDQGPILFRQRRIGRDGKEFTLLKFRTMIVDAEKLTGAIWSTANDDRITRPGRLLRATALDELPQILNILRGDMSFVGPRAERPELHEEILKTVPDFGQRLAMRPGLTGLAQVSGEYDLEPKDKLKHDLCYARMMGPLVDLRLLFQSVWNTLTARWDQPQNSQPSRRA